MGTRIQVSRLGGLICFQIDKLIISLSLGIAAVSFYEVSSRLTSFMRAVPLVLISALIPATSEVGARNDRAKILQIYTMASKYVVILTVAMVVYLVLEARSVVFLWVGPGFEQSVVLVQILAIGYGVDVMGGAASQTGAGIGHPEFDMRSTILLSVINPILSLLLVREFGAPGAAAGTSVALVIATVYLLMIFHNNYVGDSVWRVFRGIYLRPIVSGVLAGSCRTRISPCGAANGRIGRRSLSGSHQTGHRFHNIRPDVCGAADRSETSHCRRLEEFSRADLLRF